MKVDNLPRGWEKTTIGEICHLVNGRAFKPSDWGQRGLPIVRIQNLNRADAKFNFYSGEVDERFLVESGDLLFAWSGTPGTSFGAHIWNGGKAILNQHIFNVHFDRQTTNRNFLRYAINQTLDEQIAKAHGGVGLAHVTKGKFEETVVSLPPLPEQRRIVAKIDGLSEKSRRARKHLDHISRLVEKYKQAVLAAAFRGALTGDKGGFARRPVRDLASLVTKGASPRWQGFQYLPTGVLFVRSQNIGWGELLLADRAFVSPDIQNVQRRSIINRGDVLLNIVGASIGRAAVATAELSGANCNQAVAVIRLLESAVPQFLCYWLISDEAQSMVVEGSVDFARANFSLANIRNLKLPWPDREKQEKIVRVIKRLFDWIDRIAVEATSARTLLARLDQAVLAKAFCGELVPQDPNDEPSSKLLDRIRAEKAAGSDVKVKRTKRV